MIVIMGGTFDPVHIGHLRVATELAETLGNTVHLMPCKQAVHKDTQAATALQRMEMLKLAVENNSLLEVDGRELVREGDSYTITSLAELRREHPDETIIFVMGSDSAATLNLWKEAGKFSDLASFLVLTRPGQAENAQFQAYKPQLEAIGLRHAADLNALLEAPSGQFYELPLSELDISSSDIRHRLQQNQSIRYIVTDAVEQYICDNALYT